MELSQHSWEKEVSPLRGEILMSINSIYCPCCIADKTQAWKTTAGPRTHKNLGPEVKNRPQKISQTAKAKLNKHDTSGDIKLIKGGRGHRLSAPACYGCSSKDRVDVRQMGASEPRSPNFECKELSKLESDRMADQSKNTKINHTSYWVTTVHAKIRQSQRASHERKPRVSREIKSRAGEGMSRVETKGCDQRQFETTMHWI